MNSRLLASAAAAALVAFGFLPAASQAFVVIGGCPRMTSEERTSVVLDNVTDLGGGVFQYRYEVCNTSDGVNAPRSLLRDWELPFDGVGYGQTILLNVAGIHNIVTPFGWQWSIERRGDTTDLTFWDGLITWQNGSDPDEWGGKYDNQQFVLHFWTPFIAAGCDPSGGGSIDEGQSCGGFGFDALVGPSAAPYQASWSNGLPRMGDPNFPLRQGTPNTPYAAAEPGELGLFAAGLGALLVALRRRGRERESRNAS